MSSPDPLSLLVNVLAWLLGLLYRLYLSLRRLCCFCCCTTTDDKSLSDQEQSLLEEDNVSESRLHYLTIRSLPHLDSRAFRTIKQRKPSQSVVSKAMAIRRQRSHYTPSQQNRQAVFPAFMTPQTQRRLLPDSQPVSVSVQDLQARQALFPAGVASRALSEPSSESDVASSNDDFVEFTTESTPLTAAVRREWQQRQPHATAAVAQSNSANVEEPSISRLSLYVSTENGYARWPDKEATISLRSPAPFPRRFDASGASTKPKRSLMGQKPRPNGASEDIVFEGNEDITTSEQSAQQKIANFFARPFRINALKRTKSASKMERPHSYSELPDNSLARPAAVLSGTTPSPPNLKCSTENLEHQRPLLTRDSDRHLVAPQSLYYEPSSKDANKLRAARSDESLLLAVGSITTVNAIISTARHSNRFNDANVEALERIIAASNGAARLQIVHPSVLDVPHCFKIEDTVFTCKSPQGRAGWIEYARRKMDKLRDERRRTEKALSVWILEAKGIAPKRRYYCELYVENDLYARTSPKPRADSCFWGEFFEFPCLPDVHEMCVNLYREADPKRKKDRSTLVGVVRIGVDQLAARHPVERWYTIASTSERSNGAGGNVTTPLVKSSTKNIAETAAIRIKAHFQTVEVLPLRCYDRLLDFVTHNYMPMCLALESTLGVKAKEDLATSLVRILHRQRRARDFLCDLIMAEINALENDNLMFRGNSLATKAMEAYMKLVATDYLHVTLGVFVRKVLDSTEACEVDPLRLDAPRSASAFAALLQRNQHNLTLHVETAWGRILQSANEMPTQLRVVFEELRFRLDRAGRKDLANNLISSSIFLRFLCPAILSPSLFNLVSEYPSGPAARTLTLIAKTLQTLANFTKFGGKESYMVFMNEFVKREIKQMSSFLVRISSATPADAYGSVDEDIDREIDFGKELSLLHFYLQESWCTQVQEKAKQQNENLSELYGVIVQISTMRAQGYASEVRAFSPATRRAFGTSSSVNSPPSSSSSTSSLNGTNGGSAAPRGSSTTTTGGGGSRGCATHDDASMSSGADDALTTNNNPPSDYENNNAVIMKSSGTAPPRSFTTTNKMTDAHQNQPILPNRIAYPYPYRISASATNATMMKSVANSLNTNDDYVTSAAICAERPSTSDGNTAPILQRTRVMQPSRLNNHNYYCPPANFTPTANTGRTPNVSRGAQPHYNPAHSRVGATSRISAAREYHIYDDTPTNTNAGYTPNTSNAPSSKIFALKSYYDDVPSLMNSTHSDVRDHQLLVQTKDNEALAPFSSAYDRFEAGVSHKNGTTALFAFNNYVDQVTPQNLSNAKAIPDSDSEDFADDAELKTSQKVHNAAPRKPRRNFPFSDGSISGFTASGDSTTGIATTNSLRHVAVKNGSSGGALPSSGYQSRNHSSHSSCSSNSPVDSYTTSSSSGAPSMPLRIENAMSASIYASNGKLDDHSATAIVAIAVDDVDTDICTPDDSASSKAFSSPSSSLMTTSSSLRRGVSSSSGVAPTNSSVNGTGTVTAVASTSATDNSTCGTMSSACSGVDPRTPRTNPRAMRSESSASSSGYDSSQRIAHVPIYDKSRFYNQNDDMFASHSNLYNQVGEDSRFGGMTNSVIAIADDFPTSNVRKCESQSKLIQMLLEENKNLRYQIATMGGTTEADEIPKALSSESHKVFNSTPSLNMLQPSERQYDAGSAFRVSQQQTKTPANWPGSNAEAWNAPVVAALADSGTVEPLRSTPC